jgi:hypothetical protein
MFGLQLEFKIFHLSRETKIGFASVGGAFALAFEVLYLQADQFIGR